MRVVLLNKESEEDPLGIEDCEEIGLIRFGKSEEKCSIFWEEFGFVGRYDLWGEAFEGIVTECNGKRSSKNFTSRDIKILFVTKSNTLYAF